LVEANTKGFALGFRWAVGNSAAPAEKGAAGASSKEKAVTQSPPRGRLSKTEERQLKNLLAKMENAAGEEEKALVNP
jgi:hypothetical protein